MHVKTVKLVKQEEPVGGNGVVFYTKSYYKRGKTNYKE